MTFMEIIMNTEIKKWYEKPIGILLLNVVAGFIVVLGCSLVF